MNRGLAAEDDAIRAVDAELVTALNARDVEQGTVAGHRLGADQESHK